MLWANGEPLMILVKESNITGFVFRTKILVKCSLVRMLRMN